MEKEIIIDGEAFTKRDFKDFNKIRDEGKYNMVMEGNIVRGLLCWTEHKYTTFLFNYDKIKEGLKL